MLKLAYIVGIYYYSNGIETLRKILVSINNIGDRRGQGQVTNLICPVCTYVWIYYVNARLFLTNDAISIGAGKLDPTF